MPDLSQSLRLFTTILLLGMTSCARQQTTPLSVPLATSQTRLAEQTKPTEIPQPAPECPESARVTYNRLEEILDPIEMGLTDRELRALDRKIRSSLGNPRYVDRSQDNVTTYEWLSPDCPGWFIHASFNTNSYSIYTAEIPPPVATFPAQDAASKLRYTLVGHPREVEAITITPDGQTLISGSPDGQIHFWQLSDGQHLRQIEANDWVNYLRVSADGKTLMGLGSELTTWEIATGSLINEWEFIEGGAVHNFFSQDQRFIVSEINDERVDLWDIAARKQVRSFSQPQHRIGTIALHPNRPILANVQYRALGANQNPIVLWELASGKQLQTLTGHSYLVLSAVFSPDGQILVTGSESSTLTSSPTSEIKLWNWQKGILIRTLAGQGGTRSLAFSADGQQLATGDRNGTINVWNVQTGQKLQTLTGHTDAVIALTFDAAGHRLVSGSDDRTVRVWQLN